MTDDWTHLCFVIAAYAVAAAVLVLVAAESWWRWRRSRADFARLYGHVSKDGQNNA